MLTVGPENGALAVRGSAVANETDWDMGLPFRMDGYDPYGGIYRGDLNFQMYWDDNPDKLQRFINNLDQTDYIFISSNRQWGTTTRLPERYPLTTTYYRDLLGCPSDQSVLWCYDVAEVGTYQGKLGFDLVAVFDSYPNLGPIKINTQFAEEAFTVYDHPKVFVFKKSASYDPAKVNTLLSAVDLRNVVHLTPKKASSFKDLLLPPARWAMQQAGGTWAKLFPPDGLLNHFPGVGMVVWYLFLLLLGVLTYPLVRLALPGLPDRGYPLARLVGMLLLAYLAWLVGSLGIPVSRGLLAGVVVLIGGAGILLAILQWDGLRAEWRANRKYFLRVELLALAFFAIDLLIRYGNPDLWHPIYGGEKPMDFSFFNAVLKSSVFPPYDPWFAGGYINYYYYGFVLVGMPVKLLGITPSVAYNLVLPALFMLVALGAFSIGWNLYCGTEWHLRGPGFLRRSVPVTGLADPGLADPPVAPRAAPERLAPPLNAFWPGLIAVLAMLVLGNLGTVRMYWQGFQKLVVSDQVMNQGTLPQHLTWFAEGVGKMASGEATALPYYPGDWYWKPSRAIEPEAGNEITEFPMFTFLYADLHAHLMALPVTLLVLAFGLALVLGRGRWGLQEGDNPQRYFWLSLGLALLIGALAAGLLRPANTWDQYTYLSLAGLAVVYGQWPELLAAPGGVLGRWWRNRWVRILLPLFLLVGGALLLYAPFDAWFEQGYNSLTIWQGDHTNLNSYLTHWGLFLFVITAWLVDEWIDWLAATPLAVLNRVRPYHNLLITGLLVFVALLVGLLLIGVQIALIALPLAVLAAGLLFRPDQPAVKRAVLFMIGTGLVLTLAVELVAVKGDIGRMNTVFKFYYQAWTLLSLSAAAGLVWLWRKLPLWNPSVQGLWTGGLVLLVIGAALFPITATRAKVTDRMTPAAPHTLDGMLYMDYSTYTDGQTPETSAEMDLSQDYRAIQWMQRNITGSPVIVEANTPEYRHWGTRFTIYTGLPGVVGWNWHERQQRTITPDTWVFERIDDIAAFYNTPSQQSATEFLKRYGVQYIIVGQLERIWYQAPGIAKFQQLSGVLWDPVYQNGQTVIYKVR